jgi:serine/threonine protein kinase
MLTPSQLSQAAATWVFPVTGLSSGIRDVLVRCGDLDSASQHLVFDGHRFEGCVGQGAYGAVFVVRTPDGERRALKIFDPYVHRHADGAEAVVREVTVGMNRLSPYVVRYDRLVFLPVPAVAGGAVMPNAAAYALREFVEGTCPSFRDFRRLPDEQLRSIFRCLAEGLHAIHEHGCVHRDVKRQNAVFGRDGAKWLDLGQVRIFGSRGPRPTHVAARRPLTTPPEAWVDGEVRYDRWERPGDVFAFGVCVFDLLTDRSPWGPNDPNRLEANWAEHLNVRPLGARLRPLLRDLLRERPADRLAMSVVLSKL